MKRTGLLWKSIFFSLTGLFLAIGFYCGWRLYRNYYGTYEGRIYYSDSCYGIRFLSGHERLYNSITGESFTPKLDWIASPVKKDTLLVVSLKGKRGYLNRFTGQYTILPQFQRAWKFSEGLGAVVKNHKLGFVNKWGKEAIAFKFFYNPDRQKRIDFLFKGGYCTVADSSDRHGLINRSGEWVIKPQFDYINNPVKGYRIVCQESKYGLLNSALQWVLSIEFDNIVILNNGLLVQKEGEQKLLGFDGKTIILPFVYDDLKPLQYESGKSTAEGSEMLLSTGYTAYEINGLWGIMDAEGKIVTRATYSDIKALSKNRFSCLDGDYWITLNEKGKMVY